MNSPPMPLTKDLAEQLRELPRSQRRAQLLALMPLLDSLLQQGVSHKTLADSLTRAGLALRPESLRQARYRWRKRQAHASNLASLNTARAIAPPTPPSKPVGGITSKADLVRLRKSQEDIDLNQLAELSRQK